MRKPLLGVLFGVFLIELAAIMGLVRDWGQPFQGSTPAWLLLMGFGLVLLGATWDRVRRTADNSQRQ